MIAKQVKAEAPDAAVIQSSVKAVQSAVVEFNMIAAGLAELEAAHPKDVACDVATTAGMRQAIAGRAAWRSPRIEVEKARKAAKAPVLALGKSIDAFAATLEQKLLEGESNYDDQIKAEEHRKEADRIEKARTDNLRVEALQARIDAFAVSPRVAMMDPGFIGSAISGMKAMEIGDDFQEFKPRAKVAKDAAIQALEEMLESAIKREAEEAKIAAERRELEELRAVQAAQRERDEAAAAALRKAEQARADAEWAAQRAEQRRLDEAAASVRAEEDRKAAAVRAEEQAAHQAAMKAETDAAAAARQAAKEKAAKELAKKRKAEAAQQKMRDAAPVMLKALYALEQMSLPKEALVIISEAIAAAA